ncbi:MAG: DUF2807 domain-containing protein [Bacteroidales bacterium]|nr:DUF2807 domain-containing protein [Bacteroidales bacterium]
MKSKVILFLALLAFAGCKDDTEVDIRDTLRSFDCMKSEAYGNIVFMQANESTIHISGSRKMVKRLRYKVQNGELLIDSKDGVGVVNASSDVRIVISVPDISRVVLSGAGSFTAMGVQLNHDLYVRLDGVGKISLSDLQCENFELRSSGVGNFSGLGLQCENADVSVSGVGKAELNVECRNNLTVKADGVGSVYIWGSTQNLTVQEDGVGRVNIDNLVVLGL